MTLRCLFDLARRTPQGRVRTVMGLIMRNSTRDYDKGKPVD